MLVDYHMHTFFSRHSTGTVGDYLKKAVACGMDEVCFTEHLTLEYLPDFVRTQIEHSWMQDGELSPYIDWLSVVDRSSPITVRKGVEADYIPGYERQLKRVLDSVNLDFVLGSIHYMPAYGFEYIADVEDDPVKFLVTYFNYVRRAIETGLFDSVAHIHLGWQTVKWPHSSGQALEDALAAVVQTAKRTGTCLEVNTRSLNYEGHGTAKRYEFFLGLIADYGVNITIGSDAHDPRDVGRNYSQALRTLSYYGITNVAIFQNRKCKMVPLGTSFDASPKLARSQSKILVPQAPVFSTFSAI